MCLLFLSISTKIVLYQPLLIKHPKLKLQEKPFSLFRLVTVKIRTHRGQIDRYDRNKGRNSVNFLVILQTIVNIRRYLKELKKCNAYKLLKIWRQMRK